MKRRLIFSEKRAKNSFLKTCAPLFLMVDLNRYI